MKRHILSAVTTFYLAGCILQNILSTKTFAVNGFSIASCGCLITWAVFACMDIITEINGKHHAIKIFSIGVLANLLWTFVANIAVALPGSNPYIADCYSTILGSSLRMTIASAVAAWIGSYINTWIMAKMREKDKEKRFCLRAVISTAFGQAIDNGLFHILAFAPIIPGALNLSWTAIAQMTLSLTLIETILEAMISPATKKVTELARREYES